MQGFPRRISMIKNVVSIRLPVAEKAVIRKNRILPAGLSEKEAESRQLPRICVVTGTHGDELEGQYVCFRLNRILAENPQFVSGIVDIYPAVNPLGIDSITRGIPRFDLDMNRIFPGDAKGTTEEVIAAKIISDMNGAACAVDIHASNIFLREIPQVRVNINTADKEELMTLAGIGESKAEAIIAYREENGGFQNIEDIMKVPGIKDAAFQKIKDRITV